MPDRVDETLATIENESWLTATNEPNRQKGLERRQHMGRLIRQGLPLLNRTALNNALSLNISHDNVAEHQKLRRGVRAIMLAQFVLKKVPLTQAGILKDRWLNQPEDTLRRGFIACFPVIHDAHDPARLDWEPSNFTDPKTFRTSRTAPVGNYRFIVTCLPTDDRAKPTLADPQKTIAGWAAISTSVIDQSNSVIYGYYGFVLNVPPENVLVANSEDQNLLNHLGTDQTRNKAAEENMDPMIKAGLLSQHLMDLFAAQGRLKSPAECITQNRNERWNEVVVTGRSPSTGRATTVSGLFYRVASNGQNYVAARQAKNPITPQIEEWVQECSDWHDLPIIYIPDASGTLR